MDETPPPRLNADEKATQLAFLNYLRDVLIRKVSGLPDEAARRAGVDSGTNLLGLIKHLAGAERLWFQWAFLGEDPFPELRMEPTGEDTVENLLAAYRSATAMARGWRGGSPRWPGARSIARWTSVRSTSGPRR